MKKKIKTGRFIFIKNDFSKKVSQIMKKNLFSTFLLLTFFFVGRVINEKITKNIIPLYFQYGADAPAVIIPKTWG